MSLFANDSPIGFFNYAHSFWGAARALLEREWEDHETHSDSPSEFLYWHSIELFLKAFLLADGIPISDLRSQKKFGHNIAALTAEAKTRGLALTAKDEDLLSFMPTTGDMIELRYLRVGIRTVPEFFEIEATVKSIYSLVGRELKKRDIGIGFHATRI